MSLAAGVMATFVAFAAPSGLGLGLGLGLGAVQAQADTLAEAMSSAYLSNPDLQAQRAGQRALDEEVPQALSGWRPTLSVDVTGGFEWSRSTSEGPAIGLGVSDPPTVTTTNEGDNTPARFAISLSQPIFRGFRTVNETARAEAEVAAGQQNLLRVEQEVLLAAAAAYMDVLRDREIVVLRQRNVEALSEQLRGAEARFNVGEITRTDVAQASARLSRSEAELAVARATLAASAAAYVRVVGNAPGTLRYPRIPDLVPSSLDEALALSNRLSPEVLAAAFTAEAARHDIGVAQSQLLPSVSLQADFRANHNPSPGLLSSEQGNVLGVLQVPLYQAGRVSSQVREAKQRASQRRIEIIQAGRIARQEVVEIWNIFVASANSIESRQEEVEAAQLALEGVSQEALVGTRTTLDVLDAEQELVQAQVLLADERRNRVVAAYRLIAATGRLTAPNLGLAVPYYDPDAHYAHTRHRVFGVTVDTVDTVDPAYPVGIVDTVNDALDTFNGSED